MLVSALKATNNVVSDQTCTQANTIYAGSVSSDHSQGLALVEPLVLPGVTRHINRFFHKVTEKTKKGQ